MSDRMSSAAGVPRQRGRAPWWVPLFNPRSKVLLAAGVPLGFNGLITIRGRKSGLPRTTPVAIIAVSGRRWVWAPWGEVQWVRNLRVAGRATITVRGRRAHRRLPALSSAARAARVPRDADPPGERT
jgi:deazaflavin-dependent oxidoreductase (nitroreductase family)